VGKQINVFPASSQTPEVCCRAGDCYFKVGKYEDSIRCFQKVVDNYPKYEHAWHAQFTVGRCYEELRNSGKVEKATADAKVNTAYKQIVENILTVRQRNTLITGCHINLKMKGETKMKAKLSSIILILTVFLAAPGISYGCYGPPPCVFITSPADGTPFVEGNDITIDANASDTSPAT